MIIKFNLIDPASYYCPDKNYIISKQAIVDAVNAKIDSSYDGKIPVTFLQDRNTIDQYITVDPSYIVGFCNTFELDLLEVSVDIVDDIPVGRVFLNLMQDMRDVSKFMIEFRMVIRLDADNNPRIDVICLDLIRTPKNLKQ